ncbi:MAG: L-seryl-tRNA(Sec) selenium transferase [Nitrospirae bacterium GWD2_57_9]|nr:MAG: L-seryl-tRNA(Sec) selenium transferase [Nitrospirae bacterium GWD2_57_9]OGW47952.1 MAG: L-seryl-tRNA(Sec) selenium transferase [Nitrospirae bacterium GWC2_57_9]
MLHIMKELLRKLPSVDEILKESRIKQLLETFPRVLVLDAVRTVLDRTRNAILQAQTSPNLNEQNLSLPVILSQAEAVLKDLAEPSLQRVINATGVIVHTNLGRSVLSETAIKRVAEAAAGYSNLEYDLAAGERGKRHVHVEGILKRLTGVEAATAVNNNAAAVLLCLNTIARGKEVIVSRGELVEIGGSFRVPDVMERSGAILREVGTTNKTHLKDYEKAINERTGLLLKVHTSNYKIVGFTKEVEPDELVKLGRKNNLPVMWDLGSGGFLDLSTYGAGSEPTVQQAVDSGVDVLTFSGDKLLGGPQAGMILGRKTWLDPIRSNPLARALRIDKLTLAALDATLAQYLDKEKATRDIPTLWMLTQPLAEIERKAELLSSGIRSLQGTSLSVTIQEDTSQSGGGALPTGNFPTRTVCIRHDRMSANKIESALRLNKPHIIARIKEGMVVFDPRTLNDGEIGKIVEAMEIIVTTDKTKL